MKIVVLDGYTLNPGDLSWDGLQKMGSVVVFDRTPPEWVVERSQGAEILLTNKTPLTRQALEQLARLRYIGVLATGYNIVDVEAARSYGVTVTNIPDYGTHSVAQFTFALLLELCHQVKLHSDAVFAGEWSSNPDFCFWRSPQVELAEKTLGIIGLGRIGRQVARIAVAFGMQVLATSPKSASPPPVAGVRWASFEHLLREADVVSLHCPLKAETQGLINARALGFMKPSAFLINTSRGALVVEQDLAEALNSGRLAGAALDVLSAEPPSPDNPMFQTRNCLLTPHIAWATQAARARMMRIAQENLEAFLQGRPRNVVSGKL